MMPRPIVELRRRPSAVRRFCDWAREELKPRNNPDPDMADVPPTGMLLALLAFLLLTGLATVLAVCIPS